jgi:large subunit ribosomal protein L18
MIVSVIRKNRMRIQRRQLRVRNRIKRDSILPRVSIFRSLKNIYAQIIDDTAQKTVVSCSSLELEGLKGDKKTVAHAVGKELAKRAQQQGIETVVFDRGQFIYHGRVQAIADGLREGGLKI